MIAVRDPSVADRENRLPGLSPRSRPDPTDAPGDCCERRGLDEDHHIEENLTTVELWAGISTTDLKLVLHRSLAKRVQCKRKSKL